MYKKDHTWARIRDIPVLERVARLQVALISLWLSKTSLSLVVKTKGSEKQQSAGVWQHGQTSLAIAWNTRLIYISVTLVPFSPMLTMMKHESTQFSVVILSAGKTPAA
jgi:hypothetical protein